MSKSAAARKPDPIRAAALAGEIRIDRKLLMKALAAVLPANDRNSTIPVLSGILFEVETGCLRVTATNMDQYLTASIVADADRPSRFVLLNPQGLAALAKLLDTDAVTLAFDEKTANVAVRAGAVEAEFATLPADDFPLWTKQPQDAVDLHFGGAQLVEAIDRVAFAISTEEVRYYLNGIYLHGRAEPAEGGGAIAFAPWMVATDGHRLALARVAAELNSDDAALPAKAFGVIVPRPAVAMLRMLATRGAVDMRLWDSGLEIAQPGEIDLLFRSALIDGTFPDYLRVIPNAPPQHVTLSPALVTAAVRRGDTVRREKTRALKLIFDGSALTLQTYDVSGGKVTETLELPEPASQRFEHGVNGRLLADCLGSFAGPVTYRWIDPAAPLVIHSADAPSQSAATHLCVLMPMRV